MNSKTFGFGTQSGIALAASIISVIVLFVFLVPGSAFAAGTWYVNSSAAAGGNGTSAGQAFQTIQAAVNAANPGDTIEVAAGTYTENVNVTKSVTISGDSGAKLLVNTTTINGIDINANDVTIEGLDIEGPADQSYKTFAWGNDVTRGIAVHNGYTNFTITNNTIANLRNDILIDGRNTGSITNNVIDNSKSGISIQYTDAGVGNTEGYAVTISGNHEGTYGNDWGLNAHLNGHYVGATYFNNSQKIATDAPMSVQTALLANSSTNDNWTVQDQGYSAMNRTAVTVATTGTASAQGDPLGPIDTIQHGVDALTTGGTVTVSAGTYTGNVVISKANLTVKGTGSVTLNLGSGYGFDLDEPGNVATGFTMSGITVNASPSTTYAFKAYKADGLTLTDDTFNGGAGNTGGGVDLNTTSNVTISNVTSTGFHKNGFAVTAAYTAADNATPSSDIAFSNISSSNNGWDGVAFYTIGNAGGASNISHVTFTGANTVSGNGQGGIFLEGDTDTNAINAVTPRFTVTTDGTTLDLTHIAFNQTGLFFDFDINNYQTAPVNAVGATFEGKTGAAMTSFERGAVDTFRINDQLDHAAYGLVTYYVYVNDSTQSGFTGSPTYVRSGNAGDTAAIALVPAQATAARFSFHQTDGSNVYTDVAGTEHLQPGQFPVPSTGQHQYRVGVAAAMGTYTVTGEYEVSGTWYPITGTAKTYVLGAPSGSFVIPSASASTFRPSDNPLRISADDKNNSFRDVIFTVNSVNYQVNRADCDLREAGNRVLCDVSKASNWTGLANGTYAATATLYNYASNHTQYTSQNFTVSDVRPVLSNFEITNPMTTYGSEIDVKADATDSTGIKNVEFYITAPRAADGVCDANGAKLADQSVTTGTGSTYAASLDTSALTGDYCVNAIAENTAASHSNPIQSIKVAIDNTVVAPTGPSVPTNGAPNGTTLPTNEFDFTWDASTGTGPITYVFHSSLNPAETNGVLTDDLWTSGTLTSPMIHSTGAPDGTWYWQVQAADAAGNKSDWSPIWTVTLDHTATTTDTQAPVVTVTPAAGSALTGTTTFTITVTDNQPLDPSKLSHIWVYLYDNAGAQKSKGANVDLSSGTGTFTVDTTLLDDGAATLDVGKLYDAAGNASGTGDSYFKNYQIDNGTTTPPAVANVTTNDATSVSSSDATLNGTIGSADASGHSFWVSSTTIDTSSPNIPADVYSTPDMGAAAGNSAFSALLSSLTTSAGVSSNTTGTLPTLVPGMTYHYVAWANVGGTWYPGAEKTVTLSADGGPTNPGNTAPTATPQMVNLNQDGSAEITLVGSDSDAGDTLTYSISTPPAHGTLSAITGSTVTYTPAAGYFGSDSFDFVANDGTTDSAPATVSITVNAAPPAPVTPSTLTVTPSAPLGWASYGLTASGTVDFIAASDAPTGTGALQLTTSNDVNSVTHFKKEVDVALSDVSSISFDTKQISAADATNGNATLRLSVDLDGNGTEDDQLMYEPYYNGFAGGTNWNTWTITHSNGKFWSNSDVPKTYNGLGGVGAGSYASNFTLNDVEHDYPNAKIIGMILSMGSYNVSQQVAVDDVHLVTSTEDTTYNFEQDPASTETTGTGSGAGSTPSTTSRSRSNGPATTSTGNTGSTGTGSTGGQVLGAAAFNFTRDLHIGMRGDDVTELQTELIAAGYLHITAATGYFGTLTRAAVAQWQADNNITPAAGYFGPISRAKYAADGGFHIMTVPVTTGTTTSTTTPSV